MICRKNLTAALGWLCRPAKPVEPPIAGLAVDFAERPTDCIVADLPRPFAATIDLPGQCLQGLRGQPFTPFDYLSNYRFNLQPAGRTAPF